MRPLKLTMSAFGPYRDRETIDFAQLEDRRLFVISGNTGAGKTSIFDALCFALYGFASGEDRYESRMLRSHFAPEDTHTAVELEFAVGRRSFRVLRQLGHRKGGNKSETGARVELFETTGGQEAPCVDRFTVGEVNARLESLIGLSREQFSQIVMLPQGEFRKLLTSDTENKEEILRRIFKTELYSRVEDRFQQRSRELKEALKQALTECEVYIKQTQAALPAREESPLAATLAQTYRSVPQVAEALGEERAYYTREAEAASGRRALLSAQAEAKEAALRAASALTARFAEQAQKRALLAAAEARAPEMEALAERLRLAQRAAGLAPYEEQHGRASAAAEAARAQREARRRAAEAAAGALTAAEARHRAEAEREPERQAAERERQQLRELEPAVRSLAERQRELAELLAAEQRGGAQLAAAEAQLAEARAARQDKAARAKTLEQTAAALPERLAQRERMRAMVKLLKEAMERERTLAEASRLEAERKAGIEALRAEQQRLEQLWIEGQASLLAAHLHDGQPCPVCGSAEHPHKAEASAELPSREALQQAREQLQRIEAEFGEARMQVAAAASGWRDKLAGLADYGMSADDLRGQYDRLVADGQQLSAAIKELEQGAAELARLRAELEALEQTLERLTAEREALVRRNHDSALQRGMKQTLLDSELARIPAELRTPEQLAARLRAAEAHALRLEAAWREAQQRLQQAATKAAEENALQAQANLRLTEAEAAFGEAEARLREELAKAGFLAADDYRAARLTDEAMERLRTELETFRTTLAVLTRQLAELDRELTGQQPADVDGLTAELGGLKQELEAAAAEQRRADSLAQEADRLKTTMETAYARQRELESELERVADVHQVLKGDNPLKLSFERYILIEFLEQILFAANARLRTLSGGQFVLQRSDRLEKHNRQSGLGLDVYDAYTGQNRDVKTLSGGEKFNASLALALGMTDVIQSHQGGVTIEMMFIDEGFGSLDEESLNKAIETLVDLQRSGRMIGVISHVQELKQAFPAVLEVRKTKEGCSRTAIVLK